MNPAKRFGLGRLAAGPGAGMRRRRRRAGRGHHHHRQPECSRRRLQRPDAGGAGRRQRRHHARPAAPDRVPARGRHLGRDAHQHRPDPGRRIVRAALVHRRQRGARLGRRERYLLATSPARRRAGTWYPGALASKLAGADQSARRPIRTSSRASIRASGCSPTACPAPASTSGWTTRPAARSTWSRCCCTRWRTAWASRLSPTTKPASRSTASRRSGITSWSTTATTSSGSQMTDAERKASAVSGNGLSWNGPNVTAAVPAALAPMSVLAISGPAAGSAAGNYRSRRRLVRPAAGQHAGGRPADAGDRPGRRRWAWPARRSAAPTSWRCAATSRWSTAAPAPSSIRRRTCRPPARSGWWWPTTRRAT